MDKAEDSLALGLLANSSELIFVEFFFLPLDILYILFFSPEQRYYYYLFIYFNSNNYSPFSPITVL